MNDRDKDDTIIEAFEKLREHLDPDALPLLLSLERMWALDRLALHLSIHRANTLTDLLAADNYSRRV